MTKSEAFAKLIYLNLALCPAIADSMDVGIADLRLSSSSLTRP